MRPGWPVHLSEAGLVYQDQDYRNIPHGISIDDDDDHAAFIKVLFYYLNV